MAKALLATVFLMIAALGSAQRTHLRRSVDGAVVCAPVIASVA